MHWILICLLLLADPTTSPSVTAVRGHDPWVFRCALDRRPRMVVVAVSPGWWLAFDAGRGAIYKAWEGDVRFSGTVYDTRHGPQPEAIGETLFEGEPIRLIGRDGNEVPVAWRWRGYGFARGEVELRVSASASDGREIEVTLVPSVVVREDRAAGLRLAASATGLREGERAVLTLHGVNRDRVTAGRIPPGKVEPFQLGERFEWTFVASDPPAALELEVNRP